MTDWKPSRRIRDQEALIRKVQRDPVCRICGEVADEGHHVLLRSQGGDDVEENIVPLCLRCHRAYHDGKGMIPLKREELDYLNGKLGESAAGVYLERRRINAAHP